MAGSILDMAQDPGVAADERAKKLYELRLRAKHKMYLSVPRAWCRCGGFHCQAPDELGQYRKRDYLLDAYNDHRKYMAAEKRRLLHRKRKA